MPISYYVRASLFLVPLIPSIIVTIFNLYHLLTDRALRKALNNHVIILLLCIGFVEFVTDITWQVYYYYNSVALSASYAFCVTWPFFTAFTTIAIFFLMAWASIERHILVFYPNWLRTKRNQLVLHYIPLAVCILYPAIFYFLMIIALPCNYTPNPKYRGCGRYACILNNSQLALWDSIANYIVPSFVTIIFSVALFVRVVYKRYRARGQIDWRNYKKMTAQLLPISLIYMAMQLPPMFFNALYLGGVPYSVGSYYYQDGLYFLYWVPLLTPFVTVLSLPNLKAKCLKLLFCRRNRAVQPAAIEMTRRNVNQPGAAGTTRAKINQPTATEMISPKVNQPATAEVTPSNANQPTAIETIPSRANQPTANEMIVSDVNEQTATEIVSPNAHKPTGAVTIHRYLDQPSSVLPDVN